MNFRRPCVGVALASLLSVPALAQSQRPSDEETHPITTYSRAPQPLSQQQAQEAPVVTPQAVPVEPPDDLSQAYGKSRRPPVGDPIPVRRSYTPELRGSVLNGT